MKLTRTQRMFAEVGLQRGSVFLFAPPDAMRLVEECERRGVAILGGEGFKVFGEKIQPFQEHSFDLNGAEANSHAIARDFIRDRLGSDIWFEVVISEYA